MDEGSAAEAAATASDGVEEAGAAAGEDSADGGVRSGRRDKGIGNKSGVVEAAATDAAGGDTPGGRSGRSGGSDGASGSSSSSGRGIRDAGPDSVSQSIVNKAKDKSGA
jgi:hypothetical protein